MKVKKYIVDDCYSCPFAYQYNDIKNICQFSDELEREKIKVVGIKEPKNIVKDCPLMSTQILVTFRRDK